MKKDRMKAIAGKRVVCLITAMTLGFGMAATGAMLPVTVYADDTSSSKASKLLNSGDLQKLADALQAAANATTASDQTQTAEWTNFYVEAVKKGYTLEAAKALEKAMKDANPNITEAQAIELLKYVPDQSQLTADTTLPTLPSQQTGTGTASSQTGTTTQTGSSSSSNGGTALTNVSKLVDAMNAWMKEQVATDAKNAAEEVEKHTPPTQAVTNLTASHVTVDSVTLSWTKSPNTATYLIAYWESGNTGTTKEINVGDVNTYTVSGLSQCKYTFRVYSANYKTDGTVTSANPVANLEAAPTPMQPTNIKVNNAMKGYCSVSITGLNQNNANIYKSQAALYDLQGNMLGIFSGNAENVSISTSALTNNSFFGVKVRGYYTKSDGTNSPGEWTDMYYFGTKLTTPTATQKNKKVTLKWSKVKGAESYKLLISKKSGSGYKKVKALKGTSATAAKYGNTKLKSGTTYYFKVRAYMTREGSSYICDSTVKKIRIK